MLDSSQVDKKLYAELMNEIKYLNNEYRTIRKSKVYQVGFGITHTIECIRNVKFKDLKKRYTIWHQGRIFAKTIKNTILLANIKSTKEIESNYFSNDRIAIYTCVFGIYDKINEPRLVPDNCDYYIITDQNIPNNSRWKKIDLKEYEARLKGLSSVEKNRYFKMHPEIVFQEYKYSIYIDGNIQIVADPTEYIYRMGKVGIAVHWHSARNCIYEECNAISICKKDSKENIQKHMAYLEQTNMPHNYGMLECNILVREHNSEFCIRIMNEWWEEFLNYSNRDQLGLPHVLYKNNIRIEEVATLGKNVYENPSFRVTTHI